MRRWETTYGDWNVNIRGWGCDDEQRWTCGLLQLFLCTENLFISSPLSRFFSIVTSDMDNIYSPIRTSLSSLFYLCDKEAMTKCVISVPASCVISVAARCKVRHIQPWKLAVKSSRQNREKCTVKNGDKHQTFSRHSQCLVDNGHENHQIYGLLPRRSYL